MNKVIIIGNLTKDPELRATQNGTSVCNFTVAVNRPTRQGEEQKTDFLPVIVWNKTAEICSRFLAKGRKCAVIGSVQTRSWTDNSGEKHYATEIVADNVEFLTPAPETLSRRQPRHNRVIPTASSR